MVNVEEHLKLAQKIAWERYKQFAARYDFDDIYQVACLGLIEAAKNFDEERGFAFSTMAYKYIDMKILNFVRDDKWYLGFRKNWSNNPYPVSLDQERGEEGNGLNLHSILDVNSPNQYEKILIHIDLKNSLKYLTERQRKIVNFLYFKRLSQREAGELLGISTQMVNHENKKIMQILRRKLA